MELRDRPEQFFAGCGPGFRRTETATTHVLRHSPSGSASAADSLSQTFLRDVSATKPVPPEASGDIKHDAGSDSFLRGLLAGVRYAAERARGGLGTS